MKHTPTQLDETIKRVSLFNLPLDINVNQKSIEDRISSKKLLLSYLNPYAYKIARSNHAYHEALQRFDLVVCDGVGIQTATKAVFKKSTQIISLDYSGIGEVYLQMGAKLKMSLCLVGSDPDTALQTSKFISSKYPGYTSVASFDGYGKSIKKAKEYILKYKPDMVLVGCGMGKQETFLMDMVDFGWSGVGICVGGFFDKISNPKKDYPEWAEKHNVRFLGRLMKEPRRLSKRYFIDYLPFIKSYIKYLVSGK